MNNLENFAPTAKSDKDNELKSVRSKIIEHAKTNPYDEKMVEDFARKLQDMKDRGELSDIDYWRNIVDLYSELLINEQERLMTENPGLKEKEALEQNHWVQEVEKIISQARIAIKQDPVLYQEAAGLLSRLETRLYTLGLEQGPSEWN